MSGIFRFKQFEVDQSGCSMKINTDGVLLGALATAEKPDRILDIGTGTGVITLMLAQRFSTSLIDGIEIDMEAAGTAKRNFNHSPFAQRLSCYELALSEFVPVGSYDLIVSNPPYFLNSLKNPDERKSVARHTDWTFFKLLLESAKDWLSENGSLQLVLPPVLADELVNVAKNQFHLRRQWQVDIYSFQGDAPVRRIVAIGKGTVADEENREFVIYERKGIYSKAYRTLLKDFFLAF